MYGIPKIRLYNKDTSTKSATWTLLIGLPHHIAQILKWQLLLTSPTLMRALTHTHSLTQSHTRTHKVSYIQ